MGRDEQGLEFLVTKKKKKEVPHFDLQSFQQETHCLEYSYGIQSFYDVVLAFLW